MAQSHLPRSMPSSARFPHASLPGPGSEQWQARARQSGGGGGGGRGGRRPNQPRGSHFRQAPSACGAEGKETGVGGTLQTAPRAALGRWQHMEAARRLLLRRGERSPEPLSLRSAAGLIRGAAASCRSWPAVEAGALGEGCAGGDGRGGESRRAKFAAAPGEGGRSRQARAGRPGSATRTSSAREERQARVRPLRRRRRRRRHHLQSQPDTEREEAPRQGWASPPDVASRPPTTNRRAGRPASPALAPPPLWLLTPRQQAASSQTSLRMLPGLLRA